MEKHKHGAREVSRRAIRQENAVADVKRERERQDDQWGDQNHHPSYWLAILGKQVGQFGSAVLDREWAMQSDSPVRDGIAMDKRMREEAVQLTAVGLAIIEAIDRGEMPVGLVTAVPSDPRQLARALGKGDEIINYGEGPDF